MRVGNYLINFVSDPTTYNVSESCDTLDDLWNIFENGDFVRNNLDHLLNIYVDNVKVDDPSEYKLPEGTHWINITLKRPIEGGYRHRRYRRRRRSCKHRR